MTLTRKLTVWCNVALLLRPAEKRGGAWMDVCVGRSTAFGDVRLPVAHLVCNQAPPVGDQPSLMTFREVEACTFWRVLPEMIL